MARLPRRSSAWLGELPLPSFLLPPREVAPLALCSSAHGELTPVYRWLLQFVP